jgi:hypothetical protein
MTARASLSDLAYDPGTGLAVGRWTFVLADRLTCFPVGCGRVEDGVPLEPVSGEALRHLIAAGMPVESVRRVDLSTAPVDADSIGVVPPSRRRRKPAEGEA